MPETNNVTIRCSNGLYLVQGPIELRDAEGNAVDVGGKTTIALCRCGASANKPFCDANYGKNLFSGGFACEGLTLAAHRR